MAGIVFFGAFLVPDIHITDETQTFQQHFIGGGIYTALLYSYFKLLLGWKTHWTIDLLLLFAWTSAFGVASELAEFTLLKLHLTNINIEDTGWDLLANSSGAFLSYLIIKKSVSFPQS
ncbi:MAG TPA: hypothetical protein PKB15_07340 [Acidimicrobiia bacterium]|nr:hypothetical protein [Acidimicrobiia bacterium]